MAAVTICSFGGTQESKICHCLHFLPIYLPWSDETRCCDLSFLNLSFQPALSLSSFTLIKRLLSPSSPSVVRVVLCLATQSCLTLCHPVDCNPWGSSVHGVSPGKYTGVGCHAFLQGIFPIQGSNPGLPHCQLILHWWSPQGSSRMLGWAAYLFSRGSSWSRNRTGVSCIAGGFFTSWATGGALECIICISKVVDISPGNLNSLLWFNHPYILHDVPCI